RERLGPAIAISSVGGSTAPLRDYRQCSSTLIRGGRAAPVRQTEQRHVRHRVPPSATVRRERAPVASRLLLVVRPGSERARRAVCQDCSSAKKRVSPLRSWLSFEGGAHARTRSR